MKTLLLTSIAAVFFTCFSAEAQTWSSANRGFNNNVNTLSVCNSQLYAGGIFDSIDGRNANKVCQWVSDTVWSDLGGGVDNTGVWAITGYNNNVCIGGFFCKANGLPVNNIALWDGAAWSTLGLGVNRVIYAMAVYNGDLYVGGGFIVQAVTLPAILHAGTG